MNLMMYDNLYREKNEEFISVRSIKVKNKKYKITTKLLFALIKH